MKIPAFDLPLEEIRESLGTLRRPLSIAILRARNPFNVGAIIRVAHSFLVREIILVGTEPYYERAAMGMDRYENIVSVADDRALLEQTRDKRLDGYAKCEILIEIGDPYEQLLAIASHHRADLIVISTHGRTGLEHLVMGSVAEKIIRHAPCPVFVVRRGTD